MLDIVRFNAQVEGVVEKSSNMTLGTLLAHMKLGDWFKRNYLLPMASAIWSCPPRQMLEFPALTFVRFFANHGLLSLTGRPQWRTLVGGSQSYVERLSAPFVDRIRTGSGALRIERHNKGVDVQSVDGGGRLRSGHLRLPRGRGPWSSGDSGEEPGHSVRSAINVISAVLHRDTSVMPNVRRCWASWIYHADGAGDEQAISVTYWMNSLQGIDERYPLFVTLNPKRPIAEEYIFDQHVFDHPVFDFGALAGQAALKQIQGQRQYLVLRGALRPWFS